MMTVTPQTAASATAVCLAGQESVSSEGPFFSPSSYEVRGAPLGLGPNLRWTDVLRLVENAYGKPIYFIDGSESSPTVSGLWVDTEDFGAVICRAASTGCARDQVILHELVHVLLDHLPIEGSRHSEEAVEAIATEIAKRLHTEPSSDEELHFG